jgi:hypothetical protein
VSDPKQDRESDRGTVILLVHLLVIVAAIIYFTNR